MRRRAIQWFFTGGGVVIAVALLLALALTVSQTGAEKDEKPAPAEVNDEESAVEDVQEVPADTEIEASVEAEPASPPKDSEDEAPPEVGEETEEQEAAKKEGPEKDEPLKWERPRFEERKEERQRMVRVQIQRRGVKKKDVLEAMRSVPRHRFVPDLGQRSAYADRPLPIGSGQTISQPYIVALMTEMLELEPGDRVLEIGTGSGYQAAVLSELTPYVYTIEIIKKLAGQARERFPKLGYKTIKTKQGDGYYGWDEHGPFDGIIVTAAAGHVPPPLVQQLKPGGRMVIPVGGVFETQHLVVVSKDEQDRIKTRSVLAVRFVPMTGRVQDGQ